MRSDAEPAHHAGDDLELLLTRWRALSDAQWSSWYRFLPAQGRDADESGVFAVEDGVLHVLGIEPPPGEQEFGYIATREEFSNYRFRVAQRWGTRKFAPRADAVRDSGLLYHMRGEDMVWPQSAEFQIQENDIGDLFLLSGVGATTPIDPAQRNPMFVEGGEPLSQRDGMVTKGSTHESLTDWNQLELIATEREFVHIANGFVNNRGWGLEYASGEVWSPLERGRIALQAEGAEVFYRKPELRPLIYAEPPAGAVVLFDGTDLSAWQQRDGADPTWRNQDGALEVAAGSGDLVTREAFEDVRLHLEFRVPASDVEAPEQERGNSGVFVQGRYEVQILDSFARSLSDADDAAAVYGVADAALNEALPAETWQSYDIVFRAARWDGERKGQPARLTLVWNGSEVHHELVLSGSTAGGARESAAPGPLVLQDHGQRVRYRNVWLRRL